jgi:TonB family protein
LEDNERVDGAVLIAAIVRPPTFPDVIGFGDTMEGAKRVPRDVPAPLHVQAPPYPPLAVGDGVVVVEISVEPDGSVLGVVPLTPASGFDSAALAAAREWTFRPAERDGRAVAGCAYVLFGFVSPALNTPG